MISKDTTIEDLISEVPDSIRYLMDHGIRCLACGEPVWCTLEEAAREKGFSDKDIETFVMDLSSLRAGK
jgi:hypothetical protein